MLELFTQNMSARNINAVTRSLAQSIKSSLGRQSLEKPEATLSYCHQSPITQVSSGQQI